MNVRTFVMTKLTPAGLIWYGMKLAWWRWAHANLMRTNPTSPDIAKQVLRMSELHTILRAGQA